MLQQWEADKSWLYQTEIQHYLENSFWDNIFYVVETKNWKEIIVGHPVSVRLGLICVLCKNVSKSISAPATPFKTID